MYFLNIEMVLEAKIISYRRELHVYTAQQIS